MTQHDFIHKCLFPLLSFQAKQDIYNYTASRLDVQPCIEVLTERKLKLQVEVNNLEEAIRLLRGVK